MATRSMPNIFTRDIEAALAFYRDQLGFTTVYQVPAGGRPEHVVLGRGDSQLALSYIADPDGNWLALVDAH